MAQKEFKELHSDVKISIDVIDGLVNSFDDELFIKYKEFTEAINDYLDVTIGVVMNDYTEILMRADEMGSQSEDENWDDVREHVGSLRKSLREKLISIRDTD